MFLEAQSIYHLNLYYFNPSTNVVLLLTLPLTVFIVIDVFCPFMPRSRSSFSNMNVPWLKLSSNACVFTIFPEQLYVRFTGITHMLITFPPVLTVAYFTSTPFGVSALSFFLIIILLFLSNISMKCCWMFVTAYFAYSSVCTRFCIMLLGDFFKTPIT